LKYIGNSKTETRHHQCFACINVLQSVSDCESIKLKFIYHIHDDDHLHLDLILFLISI